MNEEKGETGRYFQEALGDFVHDAASGGAIRHLLDMGYTTEEIIRRLDFPTPRARVEKTVYRYLRDTGVLLEQLPLPPEKLKKISLGKGPEARLYAALRARVTADGEENSYVSCPFGTIRREREARLQDMMSCLTAREREYLLGIPWPPQIIYHRLNSRMLELSVCLAARAQVELQFYFLRSKEVCSR